MSLGLKLSLFGTLSGNGRCLCCALPLHLLFLFATIGTLQHCQLTIWWDNCVSLCAQIRAQEFMKIVLLWLFWFTAPMYWLKSKFFKWWYNGEISETWYEGPFHVTILALHKQVQHLMRSTMNCGFHCVACFSTWLADLLLLLVHGRDDSGRPVN